RIWPAPASSPACQQPRPARHAERRSETHVELVQQQLDRQVGADQLVTAALLAAVQTAVGGAVKVGGVTAIHRPGRQAKGGRQRYLLAAVVQRLFGNLLAQLFHQRGSASTVSVAQQQTELLPSQARSEEHTSELQSRENLVCRLLLEKKKH